MGVEPCIRLQVKSELFSFPFFRSRQSEDTEESGTTEHPFYYYLSDYEDYEEYPNAYNDYQTDNGTSGFPHVIDETGFLSSSLDDFVFDNETTE